MFVCCSVSCVYHQNFSSGSAPGGCQNPKNLETLKAYSTKTVKDKLMIFGILRDSNVLYLVIESSLYLTLTKELI